MMVEKEVIGQVLRSCGGVQTRAASRLGINRNTLHKRLPTTDWNPSKGEARGGQAGSDGFSCVPRSGVRNRRQRGAQ